jgi:sarcosine oxidase
LHAHLGVELGDDRRRRRSIGYGDPHRRARDRVKPDHAKPVTRADVVVVGGGLLGLSTAWALRGRRDVLVLERETVGNERSGSHGPTRIFRLGYVDPEYVVMAQHAAERWRVLERESGVQLLHPTPQLTFGAGAGAVLDALTAAGVRAERISAAAIEQRFPAFGGRGDAVLETTSAVIAADRTLAALREQGGAEVREHVHVERVDASRIETADEIIDARDVVVCAGPWTGKLVPGIATTTTLEHAGYVRVGGQLPIFIDFTDPAVYGLPTPGCDVYKLAVHHGGPVIDPGADFVPDEAAVSALQHAIDHWLPGAELLRVDVCPYDNTTDERFVVDRIDGIVVGAGTSGHAFKFGPLLGGRLAELVLAGH